MSGFFMRSYRSPVWLPDGHSQTIVPALFGARLPVLSPQLRRDRWETPDGDFIDVDSRFPPGWTINNTLLILFHGLEGSSQSHYAKALGFEAARRGWGYIVPHFRGCSGAPNVGKRAYHSGDLEEIHWILNQVQVRYGARSPVAIGVSLGGNALAKWLGAESGRHHQYVHAAACVCAPLDLAAAAECLDRGVSKLLYVRTFLKTMQEKAKTKSKQWPDAFDLDLVMSARTLHQFDDAFTAPLHGYSSAADYWTKASAKLDLANISSPLLLINAKNDPFVPIQSIPYRSMLGPGVEQWVTDQGGHVGFPGPGVPFGQQAFRFFCEMPIAVCDWLESKSKGKPHNG